MQESKTIRGLWPNCRTHAYRIHYTVVEPCHVEQSSASAVHWTVNYNIYPLKCVCGLEMLSRTCKSKRYPCEFTVSRNNSFKM